MKALKSITPASPSGRIPDRSASAEKSCHPERSGESWAQSKDLQFQWVLVRSLRVAARLWEEPPTLAALRALRSVTRTILSAVLLASFTAGVSLAQNPAPPAPAPDFVIVPYDPTKPAAQQKPDQLYLPYPRFLELWESAKANRKGPKLENAPVPFVLSTARYEGVLGERTMTFTGKLDVTTYNESWVEVPLPFKDVKVSGLKIDGVAAAFDGARIVVEKSGRHQVEVAFEIPFARGAQSLEWGVPRTGATLLELTLPDARTRATVTPGSGVIERAENGKNHITAALGTTDRVRVDWKATTGAARVAESALATLRTQLVSRIGREEIVTEFTFSFPGARQDKFTVYFDKALTLTKLDAVNVKSWRLAIEDTRQALEIVLNEPVDESYSFQIGAERPLAALPADLKAPLLSAAARRVEYAALALGAGERIELTPKPEAGQRQVPWDRPPGNGERVVAAYAGAGQPAYRVALRETQREARIDYVYQVNRRKIELIASLQLYAHGDDVSTTTLSLPAQFDVQAVESERLQDWWREGDTLHLRFRGATPGRTPLVVYLVRQYAAAPTDLDVRPLVLDGFKKVEGEAVVAAHKGVEATMKLSADAKEMAPDKAATDFQILPPLERKRGFSFKTQTFSAQVALAALPARTTALWVMNAQAHEGWVALSTHARLTMRQGSIDRVTYSLPATVPEARVSGDEVRETRSRVEGDRRIYEVQFQNDVYESVEFTLDLELPNPGELALPTIAFPDAQMTSGYVLTDNASEFEMKLKTSGVDPAPASEVPFLPELSKAAGVFRTQPNWTVTMGVERLEKAAARAAFVAWADLTTALRRDGTEWHRATYRLQNRSLQFLPVKMPAGAELMSVRVAGQSVRADAGKVGGTSAILVPLIKTKPGDLSYNVELVYRVNAPALGWRTGRNLDDPELLGITVERTFWNVWLPEDRKLASSSGNMEPVLAEVNKADKLEGALQEVKALNAIANSTKASFDARCNAIDNIERLKKEIEVENRDENFSWQLGQYSLNRGQSPSPTPAEEAVGKKGITQQGEYVANKRREVTAQLDQEVAKARQANADLGRPNQGEVVGTNTVTAGTRSGASSISANAIDALIFNQNGQAQLAPRQQALNLNGVTLAPAQQGLDLNSNLQGTSNLNPQRWLSNATVAPNATTATPAPSAPGSNFYFNDNVVLQQKVAKPETKAEAKPSATAKSKQTITANPAGTNVFSAGGTQGYAVETPVITLNNNGLNTARGNTLRNQEEQMNRQQEAAQQQPQQQQRAAQAPAAPAPANQPGAPMAPPPAVPGLEPPVPSPAADRPLRPMISSLAGVFTDPQFAQSGAQQLQPAGRVSLAVDFPTEGQLYHFKKVKANAQLGLTVTTPETLVRWQYLAAAVALAGVLLGLDRWAGRRSRARKSVAPPAPQTA